MRALIEAAVILAVAAARAADAAGARAAPAAQGAGGQALPAAVRAEAIMAEVERLVVAEGDAHTMESGDLERRIRGLGREFRRMDVGAVAPLARYLSDKRRPHKARLYAAAFLGLEGDPAALMPLSDRLMDDADDPSVRSTCLNSVASLRLKPETIRGIMERAVQASLEAGEDKPYPADLLREATTQLAGLGVWNAPLAVRAARRGGPDPQDIAGADARHLVRALELSRNPKAPGALLELLAFFRRGSLLETATLEALETRKAELVRLDELQLQAITDVLLRERGPNAVRAARLLGEIRHPLAVEPLLSALWSPDPGLVAEAAEALAEIGDPAAAAPLGRLAGALLSDPRFAPAPGGPDVAPLAERVQRAAQAFPSNK